jgi:hypothetical protein
VSGAVPDRRLPARDFSAVIASYGHEPTDSRDVGLRRADDPLIAAHAQRHGMALFSEDWGFADVRAYQPSQYHGLVIFETHDDALDQEIAALRHLLDRHDVVQALPGRLAIVTPTRIRLRPPL